MSRSGQQDRAWCAAAALVYLDAADEEHAQYYQDYRPLGLATVHSQLTEELWRSCLRHPDEDLLISKLVETVTPAVFQVHIEQLTAQHKLPTLDLRFRQDPVTSTVTFAKLFGSAALVLGVSLPDLYIRSDVPGSLLLVPAVPLASIAGQSVLSGFTPVELSFICGRHLARYRGEHYVTGLFGDPEELVATVWAAKMIDDPNARVPPQLISKVEPAAQAIAARMQPAQLETLRMVTRRMAEQQSEADVRAWQRGVEFTTCRAGLLLCGDLTVAQRVLQQMRPASGGPSTSECLEDLLRFSVTEEYFRLRQHLGLAIGATHGGKVDETPRHEWAETLNALPIRTAQLSAGASTTQPSGSGKVMLLAIGILVAIAVLVVVLAGQ